MGAGASSGTGELVVGDVVTVKLETHNKRVIGLIADIVGELCSVQVSSSEILEDIPLAEVKRIANWNEIEEGDIVKVKEKGSKLYYEANVISRNEDGTFKVKFGEEEVEDHITQDRMLKLMSGRLEQREWMMFKDGEDDTN
ncbi:TPA: hypothetical protein N0F65_001299 [Lagenidium giganteum]|uniref:Uncharacterized protein n=1 Tax=Lagenidium giganteum TaxID=4803 RepID=A0AAV2Z0E6_9STRA|nr:TPA: hypothetical protein N0F65_001299 [Lagenidium giganteum]